MHLLALSWQLTNCAGPLAHELRVGHPVRALLLHGLRTFVRREGNHKCQIYHGHKLLDWFKPSLSRYPGLHPVC